MARCFFVGWLRMDVKSFAIGHVGLLSEAPEGRLQMGLIVRKVTSS